MKPHIFVIFGASGDLSKRKLIPAIYELYKSKLLPKHFAVLGVSRSALSDDDFRKKVFLENDLLKDNGKEKAFADCLFYESIDTLDVRSYAALQRRLHLLDEELQTQSNYIFYLSTPPDLYGKIPAFLAEYGLNDKETGFKRLVIEKPFGYDKESAKALNRQLQQFFDEEQIYRIDHYLGKETVQNLLVTRFGNGIFEPLWNRNYIQHIEITASENIGVEKRGGYYDHSGALRDMVQNHLLQVAAHVAMEPPIAVESNAIKNEKLKFFHSLRPIKESEVEDFVVRGQYMASKIKGEDVLGYREEEEVIENSMTETYVAMKFFVDNWRWADVPFYIRTGKRLPTKVTEIVVTFKSPPQRLFRHHLDMSTLNNRLVIRIQPDEGLLLNFGMKVPGAGFEVKNVGMDFHYSDLTDADVPEAYERLLMDVMNGDATLYASGDSLEAAWNFVDPILYAWKTNPNIKLHGYPAGTWGPQVADELMAGLNTTWRNPCRNLSDSDLYCEL